MKSATIVAKVEALSERLGGRFRLSNAGVPMFTIDVDGVRHSACFFARHNNWAVFYPYLAQVQTRVTLPDEDAVVDFITRGAVITKPQEGIGIS